MADFLLEIGLEEVPARMIAAAQAELAQRVVALLERERLVAPGTQAKSYATPRRLAVLVRGLAERQEDTADEVLGPAMKIAFKDGVAGPAAVAFAKKAGVTVSELRVISTAKGEYVAATVVSPGRDASEVLAAELPKQLAGIYWAKNMYWRAGKPERFVRPVRWLVALLGDTVVPVEFGGCTAGRETFGHRVLFGPAAIHVESPESYEAALTKAFVMADVELRRHTIRKALDRVCRSAGEGGLRWREDHVLVDKMTHLTEWPSVIAGGFDAEYLQLPQEVLVTVMRDHQSYFAVEDATGELAPHFLTVLNTVADQAGEAVIRHGNERVLRARFNDARFFWEFDQRVSLNARSSLLAKVTFQKELGSYSEKMKRMQGSISGFVEIQYQRKINLDKEAVSQAARLAKADLTTELVKEFTELQGIVGGLYAQAQGESQTVHEAVYDQYRPVSMEDGIPRSGEGQLLALIDKADTIAGMFALGLEPTGSKDPFALRRAGNGIVRILAEGSLVLHLHEITHRTARKFPFLQTEENAALVDQKMLDFLKQRLDFYLREARGQSYDVVNAVLSAGFSDVKDAVARCEAVSEVRETEDFRAISAAFKRIKNILEQARERNDEIRAEPVFDAPYEVAFWEAAQSVGVAFVEDCSERRYASALSRLATLRAPIDSYFAEIMVMAEDRNVRANRLGMLRKLAATLEQIADFSEIVTAG